MAYKDLRDFLRKLEKNGELLRVTAEVDPMFDHETSEMETA